MPNFIVSFGGVRDVDNVIFQPVTIESLAARPRHHAVRPLVRHQFATLPNSIFPRRPHPLVGPRLKVGFRAAKQEGMPGCFECDPGIVKRCRRAAAFSDSP